MNAVCGRFASYRAAQDLAEAFDVDDVTPAAAAVPASYNVAPTQKIRVLLDRPAGPDGGPRREMHAARWGLVPAWADDPRISNRMINARRESLDTRPAFRDSLRRRRCVVPVEGYYEWQRLDGRRLPFFITSPAGEPLALAGLYAFWRDPSRSDDDPDRWLLSATIITTAAVGELAEIHDRVPVVLPPGVLDAWLSPGTEHPEPAHALLVCPTPRLVLRRVSTRVNTSAVDDRSLIDPV